MLSGCTSGYIPLFLKFETKEMIQYFNFKCMNPYVVCPSPSRGTMKLMKLLARCFSLRYNYYRYLIALDQYH